MGEEEGAMRSISVFLGSSRELETDRILIGIFFGRLKPALRERGIDLRLYKWEYASVAMFHEGGKQEEYNLALTESDLAVFLFGKVLGEYTVEELERAHRSFLADGTPRLRVWFKSMRGLGEDMRTFRSNVPESYGVTPLFYDNVASVMGGILHELEGIGVPQLPFEYRGGDVLLDGRVVIGRHWQSMAAHSQRLQDRRSSARRLSATETGDVPPTAGEDDRLEGHPADFDGEASEDVASMGRLGGARPADGSGRTAALRDPADVGVFVEAEAELGEDKRQVERFLGVLGQACARNGARLTVYGEGPAGDAGEPAGVELSDLAAFLHKTGITSEQRALFDRALKASEQAGYPSITTFFKQAGGGDPADAALAEFRDQVLSKQLKHYYSPYSSVETVNFRMALELERGGLDLLLRVKGDNLVCGTDDRVLLDLSTLPGYRAMRELADARREWGQLDDDIVKMERRATDLRRKDNSQHNGWKGRGPSSGRNRNERGSRAADAGSKELEEIEKSLQNLRSRRQGLGERIEELRATYLEVMRDLVAATTGDQTLSPARADAYRLLEEGKFDESADRLDAAARASLSSIDESGDVLASSEEARSERMRVEAEVRQCVEEYLQRAKILVLTARGSKPDDIRAAYERAAQTEREYLGDSDIRGRSAFGKWLLDHGNVASARTWLEEALATAELNSVTGLAATADKALVEVLLAEVAQRESDESNVAEDKARRRSEAIGLYRRAIDDLRDPARTDPRSYGLDYARARLGLAHACLRKGSEKDIAEAVSEIRRAREIIGRCSAKNRFQFLPALGESLCELAELELGRSNLSEALDAASKGRAAFEELCEDDDYARHVCGLVRCMRLEARVYMRREERGRAEGIIRLALDALVRLGDADPIRYERELKDTRALESELARLRGDVGKAQRTIEFWLGVRGRENPAAYGRALSAYQNIYRYYYVAPEDGLRPAGERESWRIYEQQKARYDESVEAGFDPGSLRQPKSPEIRDRSGAYAQILGKEEYERALEDLGSVLGVIRDLQATSGDRWAYAAHEAAVSGAIGSMLMYAGNLEQAAGNLADAERALSRYASKGASPQGGDRAGRSNAFKSHLLRCKSAYGECLCLMGQAQRGRGKIKGAAREQASLYKTSGKATLVARDYLETLRRQIEGHPLIGARQHPDSERLAAEGLTRHGGEVERRSQPFDGKVHGPLFEEFRAPRSGGRAPYKGGSRGGYKGGYKGGGKGGYKGGNSRQGGGRGGSYYGKGGNKGGARRDDGRPSHAGGYRDGNHSGKGKR